MKLQENESLIFELKPSRKVMSLWLLSRTLPVILLVGFISFLVTIFVQFGRSNPAGPEPQVLRPALMVCIISMLVVTCLGLLRHYLRLKSVSYYVTDRRCIEQGGVLSRKEISIPFHKITDVTQTQSLGERVLGLWTVAIFSAGSTVATGSDDKPKAAMNFIGLPEAENVAEKINEFVARA